MDLAEQLSRERRARLAAERMLALKQAELSAANATLSRHAKLLSGQILETRGNLEVIRQQAAQLQNENSTVRSDLDRAESAAELAERRLWISLEAIREGFAVFDQSGILVHANRAFRNGFDGIAAAEPGASVTDLIRLAVEEGLVDHGRLPGARWARDMETLWAEGATEPRTVKLWNGQFVRLILQHAAGGDRVLIVQNITRTIRRVAVLREARQRAEAASRAKSSFLANMSHEIRTPMNGVVGMADLLCETPLTDDQKTYVDAIRGSGEALLVIINDILDYSKIEARRLALNHEPFDLELTIREVARMVHPAIHGKDIDLVVDYELGVPKCFRGDPGRIRQVLVNLAGNAAKFTEAGRIVIRVAGLPADAPGRAQRLQVTVEDTGIGIAPEDVPGIWGEFIQVQDGRNRLFGGTGLGLAITRQLVELMGGRIWVDSEPGQGSCFGFEVNLPVAGDHEEDVPRIAGRAVVIDRYPATRAILVRHAAALGLCVEPFATMGEALAAGTLDEAVVIADHAPPSSDAAALVAALKGRRLPHSLILTESGPDRAPRLPEVAAVLTKPVLLRDLRAALLALPALPEPAPPAEVLVAPAPVPVVAEDDGPRPMRVLVAEDNATNRLLMERMLRGLPLDLTFAENGIEAIEAFEQTRPELVFTDISMPRMDGKEATRHIRAMEAERGWPRTPIVAVTAHALVGDAEEILSAGIDAYMKKPVRKAELIAHLLDSATERHLPLVPAVRAAAG